MKIPVIIALVLSAATSWAVTHTVPVNKAGALTARGPVTVTASTQDCVVLTGTALSKYSGSKLTFCGPHKAYTDDKTQIGTVNLTDGGCGNNPDCDDDKFPHGPSQVQPLGLDAGVAIGVEGEGYLDENGWHDWNSSWHPGMFWMDQFGIAHLWAQPEGFMGNEFQFIFQDTMTGSWTTYVINIPLISGTVTFTGTAVGGFGVSSYTDIKIGTFMIGSGPKIPSKSTEYMKSQP